MEVQFGVPLSPTGKPASPAGRGRASSTSSDAVEEDRAYFSKESMEVADSIRRVKEMPEVRPELVQAFRKRVREGSYPPPQIIDGLLRLVGQLGDVER